MPTTTILVGALALTTPIAHGDAVETIAVGTLADSLEARVWLDRGVDPVFQTGDRATVYYRASSDAYLALFHIDTDGVARLLAPGGPEDPHTVEGGQDYRLRFPESTDWVVDEAPGVGYFFALASERPLDFTGLARSVGGGTWTLARVGTRVYEDPHVVMDQAIEALLPGRADGGFALDFTAYHVGEAYSYPRFLCYACHAPQAFESWNPYHRTCVGYRVVIHNDPYYYPAGRYRGDRVVFPRPPERGLPQFAFEARGPGDPGTPLVVNRARPAGAGAPDGVARTDAIDATVDLPTLLDAFGEPDRVDPRGGALPPLGRPADDEPVRSRPVLQRRPPR